LIGQRRWQYGVFVPPGEMDLSPFKSPFQTLPEQSALLFFFDLIGLHTFSFPPPPLPSAFSELFMDFPNPFPLPLNFFARSARMGSFYLSSGETLSFALSLFFQSNAFFRSTMTLFMWKYFFFSLRPLRCAFFRNYSRPPLRIGALAAFFCKERLDFPFLPPFRFALFATSSKAGRLDGSPILLILLPSCCLAVPPGRVLVSSTV